VEGGSKGYYSPESRLQSRFLNYHKLMRLLHMGLNILALAIPNPSLLDSHSTKVPILNVGIY
jgi:hypothetical protein